MDVAPLRTGVSYMELLRRGGMTYERLASLFTLPEVNKVVAEQAEIHAKYEGYIAKQKLAVERALKLENKKIPENFDYKNLKELSGEAMEKLMKVKPDSVGQAARISGVSPADVGVLLIALEVKRRREEEKHE
jgi:tRNA uridine 5-carboxymethylaminomethyl modification enzyme